jgi:hypothetical protein
MRPRPRAIIPASTALVHRAAHVDVEHAPPLARIAINERPDGPELPSIVDEHIDRPDSCLDLLHRTKHARHIGHIHRKRPRSTGLIDEGGGLLDFPQCTRHGSDLRPCLREGQRNRTSDAAPGARHDRDPPFQVDFHALRLAAIAELIAPSSRQFPPNPSRTLRTRKLRCC